MPKVAFYKRIVVWQAYMLEIKSDFSLLVRMLYLIKEAEVSLRLTSEENGYRPV